MAGNSYTKEITVQHAELDIRRRMKPGALLRAVEQISVEHAEAAGLGDAFFAARAQAMLLGRQAVRFDRAPLCAERLTLTTRLEQCRRGTFKRVTRVTDAAGRDVALVDARWILVDTQSGHILRGPDWETENYWFEQIDDELPQKVTRPDEALLQSAGLRRADYSLCDSNGHINNTCYMDIACDALPPQALCEASVAFAAIKYSREVPLGEEMALFREETENGWYVTGRRDGKTAFECQLSLGNTGENGAFIKN